MLQEGLKARKKVSRLRFQTAIVKVEQTPEWLVIRDSIYATWTDWGLPRSDWGKAQMFLERWIDGMAWFVAPTSKDIRNGVKREMWNNPDVWIIAAKWANAV